MNHCCIAVPPPVACGGQVEKPPFGEYQRRTEATQM